MMEVAEVVAIRLVGGGSGTVGKSMHVNMC